MIFIYIILVALYTLRHEKGRSTKHAYDYYLCDKAFRCHQLQPNLKPYPPLRYIYTFEL